ncbi:eCIS core domain-containing protein [Chitinophaga sancti]|uniref:DUF4157 domain-containing protein n=1 Tax=Chitinophaga sancti TaxID=1004 RepID=A0A1K1S2V9_9BACT|nr:DUF4157 domain-containing protein [Chitinophaga sancti]WQD59658.1 DUF4157 domain-containing protein [Chitinophaga sancti]WQG88211.1 DUF4157 domain-containing protein [Chitinophaga sancti]SFW78415.1 protein of unknown function [Chitinophaga sancti]
MLYANPQRESSHSSSSSAFFGEQQSSSFFAPVVQAKLNVNSPGDKYEQEADAVADKVSLMPDSAAKAPAVQRKCAKCEEEDKKEQGVMRKEAAEGGIQAPPQFESKLADTKGAGMPMAADTRSFMEGAFQTDLSHVRIHNNAAATSMSSTIQAKAFTHGSDIYFNSGQYNPQSKEGKHLLAHELTHTQQQGKTGGAVQRAPADGGVSTAVPYEKYGEGVESSYRQAGLVKEANAVQLCRVWGECEKVITEQEAYEMYRSGRITIGLDKQPQAPAPAPAKAPGTQPADMRPMVAGAPLAAGFVRSTAAAATAVEGTATATTATAATQGGATLTVLEGGATAATATPGTASLTLLQGGASTAATATEGAAVAGAVEGTAAVTALEGGATVAAPAAGAGVATVAIPVAVGVIVIVAAVSLVSYANFQAELQSKGITILPAPLGVCIANCHQPKAPLNNNPWGKGGSLGDGPFSQPWTQPNPFQQNPWGPITSWRGPLKPLTPTTPVKPATPAVPKTTPAPAPVKPATPTPGTKPAPAPVKPATPPVPKTTPVTPVPAPVTPAKPTTKPAPAPVKPAAPTTKPSTPVAPDATPNKRTKKKTSPKPRDITYPNPFPHTSPWDDVDDDTKSRCRTEWIEAKFGRFPCHSDYAKLFSGTRLEYRVTTPEGLTADFDAVRGDLLIEVKTGFEWMLNKNLGEKMKKRKKETLDRFLEQSIRQMLIGMECGYDVEWYFNSKPVAEMMKELLPHVEVKWRPYDCDVDGGDDW